MLIAIYYADGTCDAKIYNFTLPTRQSFKHIELSNHKSLEACFKVFVASSVTVLELCSF